VDAHRQKFITISPMNSDMSAGKKAESSANDLFDGLTP